MLEWINSKYGTDLHEEDLVQIKNFTLLWNIFENTCFQCSFTIAKLEAAINQGNFHIQQFAAVLTYFQHRYFVNGLPSNHYAFLNFRPNDREPLVSQVLRNQPSTDQEKLLAMGVIVYRYRNNLFHGGKNFMEIHEQHENFTIANTFLRLYLDS